MIGRNSNDEAALLGGNTPHKNSDELVKWLKRLIMRDKIQISERLGFS